MASGRMAYIMPQGSDGTAAIGGGQIDIDYRRTAVDDPYGRQREALLPFLTNMFVHATKNPNTYRGNYSAFLGKVGGHGGWRPVSENPIWGENQIQQRVNQTNAQNTATSQNNIRAQQQQLANRGYSAGSPINAYLQSQQEGMGMMANSRAENDLRWQAAMGNAQHVQQAQMANQGAFGNYMQQELARRQLALQAMNADRAAYMQNQPSAADYMQQLVALMGAARPQRYDIGTIGQSGMTQPKRFIPG